MRRGWRVAGALPLVAPLVAAAALAGAAAVTVQRAGCDDPGRYVVTSEGVSLVGGCLQRGDLPVGPLRAPGGTHGAPGAPTGPTPAATDRG